MNRLFSSRQSLPMLGGAIAIAVVACLIVRSGSKAVDDVSAVEGHTSASGEHRELVTIRINSKWKLKRASWGSVEVPEKDPVPEDETPDPNAKRWDGLDIAVTGR